MEADLKELEAALGHEFSSPELLVRALTHRSLAHELAQADAKQEVRPRPTTSGLNFSATRCWGSWSPRRCLRLHPEWREGELTRIRSGLVSRQHMAQVAEEIGLGKHLRLSRGEERSGLRRKSTVLSNTMEAVMGALFLDGGLEPVRAFVRSQVMGEAAERLALELRSGAALGNYKSALQERLQAARAGAPVYRVKSESGPDHHKRFLVEVRLKSEAGERESRWPAAWDAPRSMPSRTRRAAHWSVWRTLAVPDALADDAVTEADLDLGAEEEGQSAQ